MQFAQVRLVLFNAQWGFRLFRFWISKGPEFLSALYLYYRLMFPSSFKARSFVSYVQTTLQPATHHSSFFAFIHRAYSKDLSLERGWEGGRHRTGCKEGGREGSKEGGGEGGREA